MYRHSNSCISFFSNGCIAFASFVGLIIQQSRFITFVAPSLLLFSAAFYSLLTIDSLYLSFVSFLFSLVHFAGFSSFDLLTYFCFYDTSRIRIIIWYIIKASLLPMLLSLRIYHAINQTWIISCSMRVWWLILICIHIKTNCRAFCLKRFNYILKGLNSDEILNTNWINWWHVQK